jgi:DNA-binding LytR/AlgR family response regulator
MNVVIIEDELITAKDLAETLKQIDATIMVRATLSSVKQATSFFATNDLPDLIFSDVQLGDGLSFEIFRDHPINVPIIFCTAYDEYALEAFKANGIDYILKPFTNASLQHTLEKYKRFREQFRKQDDAYDKVIDLLHKKPGQRNTSILVFQNERIIPVPFANIALFFIHNKMTLTLCFDQQIFMINQPLEELEGICGGEFYRTNRQYLVHRKAIKEVSYYYGRKLMLQLTIPFKDTITIPKEKYADFLQWLSNT